MSDYDNKLSGALFKNDKGDNPSRPDYKGSFTDGQGNEFWVASWVKTSKDGKPFMSISMTPKESKEAPKQAHTPKQEFDTSNDLPF